MHKHHMASAWDSCSMLFQLIGTYYKYASWTHVHLLISKWHLGYVYLCTATPTDTKQNTGLCTQACAYTYDISRTLSYEHMFKCTITNVKWNTGLCTPVHRHTTDIKQNTGLCTHTSVYTFWYWVEHNSICTCSHVQLLILNGILDYVHLYTGTPTLLLNITLDSVLP